MENKPKVWQFGTTTGQPITVGGRTIVPEAQAVALNTPLGGFVWNRPTAVLVEQDGVTARVPILDVTRFALLAIWGLSFVVMALAWLNGRRPHQLEENNE
ncbi:MAG: hypothetical protein H6659_13005 [Ardenticatenaceae bacterium]|nr:hypothetical protein [Ardenticatenaceae bacterium]